MENIACVGNLRVTWKYDWETGCDVEATLSVIGGRWKPIFVCPLLGGRNRFGELRRLTPNETERSVTLRLRELDADGVIERHVYAEVPPLPAPSTRSRSSGDRSRSALISCRSGVARSRPVGLPKSQATSRQRVPLMRLSQDAHPMSETIR